MKYYKFIVAVTYASGYVTDSCCCLFDNLTDGYKWANYRRKVYKKKYSEYLKRQKDDDSIEPLGVSAIYSIRYYGYGYKPGNLGISEL